MKLITLLTLVTTCWANELSLPQLNRPQYSFPQFQPPHAGAIFTESNVYLPPDTHTAIPYFTQKNSHDLHYQYLPPTGAKVQNKYPPPFPVFSSTFRPSREEDDEDEVEEDAREVFFSSTVSPIDRKDNQSQNSPGPQIEIPNRPIPKASKYFNQIDRIDTKYPALVSSTSSPLYHSPPMNRRMVQPPTGFMASQNRNDQILADQMKTASFPGHQYLPPPNGYVVGPTPDPVPILRLSNEMDLDGSYSYEALSADQTHVMQHGHVENLGTDHAENVVEGSYSYVGDNGQTYTVHYIADGNGFRASGDHLPVAPPVPEIIQRSIEYNMAEESSKPLHLRDGNYHEEIKSNIQMRPFSHHFQPPMQPSVPRNLFTVKQPEAFSNNHSGATSTQNNNLQSAASTQTPVVHYEAPKEQPSRAINNSPISPQITFLASQGAHDPSQSISRMFTSPTEGPIFRFGNLKNKFDQSKTERNSWPYNNPSSHDSVTKIPPSPTKNFISRSSIDSDDDDIMINFSDMTPEQYSHMYHSHVYNKDELHDEQETKQFEHSNQKSNKLQENTRGHYEEEAKLSRESPENFYGKQEMQNVHKNHNIQPVQFLYSEDWHNNQGYNPSFQNRAVDSRDQGLSVINKHGSYAHQIQNYNDLNVQTSSLNNKEAVDIDNRAFNSVFQTRAIDGQRSTLITKDAFIPPSQTVTSSYDYRSDIHEAREIQLNDNKTTGTQNEYKIETIKNYDDDLNDHSNSTYYEIFKSNLSKPEQTLTREPVFNESQDYASVSPITTQYNMQTTSSDYIEDASKTYNVHKSLTKTDEDNLLKGLQSSKNKINENSASTEESIKEILETNIFLKNLLKKNNETSEDLTHKNDNWKPNMQFLTKLDENKEKKEVKMFHPKIKTTNDYGDSQRKPIDISQIANLVTLKNYFESNKIKPKHKHDHGFGNVRYTHVNKNSNKDNISMNMNEHKKNTNNKESKLTPKLQTENSKSADLNANTISVSKPVDMDRMIGVAKIYKTLQRNSRLEGYGPPQLRTELMPPLQDHKIFPYGTVQGGLPPLGRAGPSMKSYLPPVFS